MNYRILGKTGLRVSEIGFGGWALGGDWGKQNDEESISALHKAIDLGINFIDTAAGYGNGRSERVIGKALKSRKDKVYVATKIPAAPGIWPPSPYCTIEERYSEKYLRESLEERLRNLDTDCIDILQLHTWTRAWRRNVKCSNISWMQFCNSKANDIMRSGFSGQTRTVLVRQTRSESSR